MFANLCFTEWEKENKVGADIRLIMINNDSIRVSMGPKAALSGQKDLYTFEEMFHSKVAHTFLSEGTNLSV